ncbi:MAG: hypothetical protein ACOC2W_00925 [bacterium]
MDDKNKILVFYIGVGSIRSVDIPEFVREIGERITPKTFEGEIIMIPVTGNDTRVECINPTYITNDELIKKHEDLMTEINENLKHQLDQFKDNKNENI